MPIIDFDEIYKNGVSITSSGTTGPPKKIFRTSKNLKESVAVAIEAQKLSKNSKVLTVTRMTHAGGLLTQSLPAHVLGAELKIQNFNAFSFLKDLKDYTHTFLTPAHMHALMMTKGFQDCCLKGKWILGGSDIVSWEMIREFVKKGATVQPNWGMSEVGPITINTVFESIDKVDHYQKMLKSSIILGDQVYCDTKIENGILYVKGPTCYKEGWLKTYDKVNKINQCFVFKGRS